jgi:hypothetical protein
LEGQISPQSVTYAVNLSFASMLPVTVAYSTTDGTARAGLDYTAVAGTLTFAPGTTSASISVPILDDTLSEPVETFTLSVVNPTNGSSQSATVLTTLTDTLAASVTTTLPAAVENLLLTGSAAIHGTGNASANRLVGNGANNSLSGAAGADTLDGGSGSDTLTGGSEPDTFVLRFGQSFVGSCDRITDYQIGHDKFALQNADGTSLLPVTISQAPGWNIPNSFVVNSLLDIYVSNSFQDVNGSLPGKQALALNSAAVMHVTAAGVLNTYLMVNDAIAGYQKASDLVVNITGYTGNLPASLTPSTWFV